jgi:hypothetical protein
MMPAMEDLPGAAKMSERMRKIRQRIVEGLALSARAVAWHEGLSWEPEERQARRERCPDHQ